MAIPLFTGERTEKESELLDKRYKQVIDALQKAAPEGAIIPEKIQAAREKERALRESDGALAPAGLLDPIEFLPDVMGVGAIGAALGSMAIKKQAQRAAPSAAGFTSKLEDVIRQKMGGKATAEEIGAMVKQAGVKQEELDDIGFEQWLQSFENNLFEKQKMSSLEPSTSVQTPKIKKEDVIEYLKSERPELDVVQYPDPKRKETLDFYKNSMMSAAAEVDNEYAALIKKYKTHSNKDVAFKESELHRHLTDARFMAEQGSSFKENGSLQILTLGLDLDPKEVISDVEQLAKRQLAYEEASKKYNFAAANVMAPKWERYSLSKHGIGQNYREYVYKYEPSKRTESKDVFESASHYPGVENPIYHIRAQDLTDKDGASLLNIDEIQSDIHQYGQKFGYKKRAMTEDEREKAIQILRENRLWRSSGIRPSKYGIVNAAMYLPDEEFAKLQPIFKETGLAVDLPYKKTWHEQAMRRMIKEALDSGKDGVSWTAGSVQAKRAGQDLGQVTSVAYNPANNVLVAYRGDDIVFEKNVPQQKIGQYVGSDIAKNLKEGASKQLSARKTWVERQSKQDDAAIEKYREWLKTQFGEAGVQNPPLIETTLNSNLNTLRVYGLEPDASAKVYDQMEKAGLTPIQISDLRSERIKYPPTMGVIEVPTSSESFGGSGMKKFYDEKLLNFARQEAKRLGGTISQTTVIGKDGVEVPLWKFTFGPKTKDLLQEKGMPLYQVPTAIGLGELMRQYKQQQEQSNER